MADTTHVIGSTGIAKKLHDNGDGTYADVVYMEGAEFTGDVSLSSTVTVTGGAGQVADVKVTLDSEAVTLGDGTAAIGKLAANSGVDIGDVDVTSLPAIPAGTNLMGKVGIDQTTPGTTNKVSIGTDGTVAVGTALPAGTNLVGKVSIDQVTAHANEVVVTSAPLPTVGTVIPVRVAIAAGQTGATAYAPTSGKKWKLLRATISCYVGGTLSLFDSTDTATTAVLPIIQMAASGNWDSAWRTEAPRTSAATNNVLKYTTSASFVGSLYLELLEV